MSRPAIPKANADTVLLANRHACSVCQRRNVQIHHIDGNPANNALENLAVLCLEHHDMASSEHGFTRKLTKDQIVYYKVQWEEKCRDDILSLARSRVNLYAVLYKNPPRIRQLFSQLGTAARATAFATIAQDILDEEDLKSADDLYQWQSLPRRDISTYALLQCMKRGEIWPSCVPRVHGHPEDPEYPYDLSPPDGMIAFHQYDLYCQILVRALLVTTQVVPFEDLITHAAEMHAPVPSGQLVVFNEKVRGRGLKPPSSWETYSLGHVTIRKTSRGIRIVCAMTVKTMYIFSNTAAIELGSGVVSGVGILQASGEQVIVGGKREINLRLVPLLLGLGSLDP